MVVTFGVLLGFILLSGNSCIEVSWTKAIRVTSHDGLFPTYGLLGSYVTVWTKYECLTLCGSTRECMGFVYVSSTSVCQMVQSNWDSTTQSTVVSTAHYYHLNGTHELSCYHNWNEYLGSCYYATFAVTEAWGNSKSHYEGLGGHLAHINHENENEYLKQLCRSILDANGNSVKACWVGLTDEDNEGVWRWDDNNETLTFTDWASGNPNDGTVGNCGCLYHSFGYYGQWGDEPCERAHMPICEIDLT